MEDLIFQLDSCYFLFPIGPQDGRIRTLELQQANDSLSTGHKTFIDMQVLNSVRVKLIIALSRSILSFSGKELSKYENSAARSGGKNVFVFVQSVHIKLALPQAAWLSIFLKENHRSE